MPTLKKPLLKRGADTKSGVLELEVQHSPEETGQSFVLRIWQKRDGPGRQSGQWEFFKQEEYQLTPNKLIFKKSSPFNVLNTSGLQVSVRFKVELYQRVGEEESEPFTVV